MDSHRELRTTTNSVENESDWQQIIGGDYKYKNWASAIDSNKTSITFYEAALVNQKIEIIKQVKVTRQKVEQKLHGETVGTFIWTNIDDVEKKLKEFDEIDEQKC